MSAWLERAAGLHEAELEALAEALERLEDLEQLFRHRGDDKARAELRVMIAYLKAKAGDVREQRAALELEVPADWQEQSY